MIKYFFFDHTISGDFMKNNSLWDNVDIKSFPKLNKDLDTDILIIGGGLTGVSTFYNLKDDKRKVTLVEMNRLARGVSLRTSAKVTFLQEDVYSKLVNNFNYDVAKSYYRSQKDSIKFISDVIDKEKIECDFEKVPSYLYVLDSSNVSKLKKEKELVESFGEVVTEVDELPNHIKVKYGFYVDDTYVFHPLKFIEGLVDSSISDDHLIYENTRIIKIKKLNDGYLCYTDNNKIKCRELVLALHYPFFLLPYLMPLKCHLEKSYILASCNFENLKFSAINIDDDILSIRYHKDYYLTIGGSHNLAFKNNYENNFSLFVKYSNNKEYEYIWSNHDVMSLDNLPYIGYIDDKMFLATGYNTWGMTNGVLAGAIYSGKFNEYRKLFDPKRGLNKGSIVNYPVNIFSNLYSFIGSKVNKNKVWYNKNPYFTKINGKSVAVYKYKNRNYVVYNRCPHLTCGLNFNEIEKTWDCPCHGSRFTLDGKRIIGPSNYDITFKA